jgi:hypothetical protein
MRAEVNQSLLASRAKWAKILSFGGMGCLVASVALVNTRPELAWAILLAGLITSTAGSHLASRYMREPRAEEALQKALKGFDDHHVLYSFLLPIEHVLVTPSGVWAILVRKQPGQFSYDGRRWRQRFSFSRLFSFLGEPGLGRPIRDLEYAIARVRERVADAGTTEGGPAGVPIEGVVVFADPRASVEVKGTSCPVVTLDNLTGFFRRELRNRAALPPEIRKELIGTFDEWAS